jgi:hypothetical protein
MRGITALALAAALALASAAASNAAGSNVAAYRAQVNAICRSYTPKLRTVTADMAAAKKAGDSQRWGYDAGYALALSLKEGLRVEHAPVPAEVKQQMVVPLRQLHSLDLALRRTITAAVARDSKAFAVGAAQIAKLAAPLNREFDAVGLRDCGSNQS